MGSPLTPLEQMRIKFEGAQDELARIRARLAVAESDRDEAISEFRIAVAQRDAETARADENKRNADAANAKLAVAVEEILAWRAAEDVPETADASLHLGAAMTVAKARAASDAAGVTPRQEGGRA